jgi:hypothetical protein
MGLRLLRFKRKSMEGSTEKAALQAFEGYGVCFEKRGTLNPERGTL